MLLIHRSGIDTHEFKKRHRQLSVLNPRCNISIQCFAKPFSALISHFSISMARIRPGTNWGNPLNIPGLKHNYRQHSRTAYRIPNRPHIKLISNARRFYGFRRIWFILEIPPPLRMVPGRSMSLQICTIDFKYGGRVNAGV